MLSDLQEHIFQPIRTFNRGARLFLLMLVIDGILLSGWQLFFNFYILQSGFNLDFLGLVNSLPAAVGLLLGIPLGRLTDRWSRKASQIIGLGAGSLAMLAEVTFHQPALIIAGAFLFGLFNMLFIISQAPLMVQLSDSQNRTMLFSLSVGLQAISGVAANSLAGQLPGLFGTLLHVSATSAAAYQAVLIVSILLGLTGLVPLWMMHEPPVPAETRPEGDSAVRRTGRVSGLMLQMTAPQILIGLGAALLIPYMNLFFKVTFQISDELLGILFGLSSLMVGLGTLMGPRLASRLGGKIRTILLVQFSSLGFLLLMGFAPFLWVSVVGYLMRGVLMNIAAPLFSAFCMEHTPAHQHGFVNALLNVGWNFGWAVGPLISGYVQQSYGFPPLFIAMAVLYLAAIVLEWKFFLRADHAGWTPAPAA